MAPSDCDIVVVSDPYIEAGEPLPSVITAKNRTYRTVYLDAQDGSRLFSYGLAYRAFDAILRTHYVADASNAENFIPWAFGLSERMVNAVRPQINRQRAIVMNFRHTSSPHSVRLYVAKHLQDRIQLILPVDASIDASAQQLEGQDLEFWKNTGRRHNPSYYDRLGRNLACATFGGYFVTRWPAATATPISRIAKRIVGRIDVATHRIVQWDSWRFWEALASGSVALHTDLEHYNCRLPVMPLAGREYIGMDLSKPRPALDILNDAGRMSSISVAGRQWALDHYAPIPTASRFLQTVGVRTS